MPVQSPDQNTDIEKDLAELSPAVRSTQLRQRWRAVFRTDPPPAFGPDLLRRSIAQRIQEQHLRKTIVEGATRTQTHCRVAGKKSDRPD